MGSDSDYTNYCGLCGEASGDHRIGCPNLPKPESILTEAQRLVHGPRQATYGHPFDDFTRIGKVWAVVLGVPEVSPEQVALCMAGLKLCRLINEPDHRDSRVDMAGYAETHNLVRERRRQTEHAESTERKG